MIRPFTLVCAILAICSGLYVYNSKREAQLLDRTIEKTMKDTSAIRDQTQALRNEWAVLNDTERLKQFADQYLVLKPMAPTQFTNMADLAARLPAPRAPEPEPEPEPAAPPAAIAAIAPVVAATAPVEAQKADGAPDAAPDLADEEPLPVPPLPAPPPVGPQAAKMAAAAPVAAAASSAAAKPATPASRPPIQAASPAWTGNPVQQAAMRTATQPQRPAIDPRPVAALAPRPVTTPAPYAGSLLGMAQGSTAAPLPRPTPIANTQ